MRITKKEAMYYTNKLQQSYSGILLFDTFDEYFEFDTKHGYKRYSRFSSDKMNELVYCQSLSVVQIEQEYQRLRQNLTIRIYRGTQMVVN